MIDKSKLIEHIEGELSNTDCFLVDLTIGADNRIVVEIDSDTCVDIDFCVALTRSIEQAFDREDEDYELEVGSAGLTSPFKTIRQYRKNIGNEVEVLTADGKKIKGELTEAGDADFTILLKQKVKKEGAKRPVEEEVPTTFEYNQVKYTKYLLQF